MNAVHPAGETAPLDICVHHGNCYWYEATWDAALARAARLVNVYGTDTYGVPLVYARSPITVVNPQPVDRRKPTTASKALVAA